MIPPEYQDAVDRGLRTAFCTTKLVGIAPITKGNTPSLVYRIVVGSAPYVLKIITRPEDQTRHYTNMMAAGDAGVAPVVRYANVADHVSISDCVAARPLERTDALRRLPALLRRLHALPPFVAAPFNTTCTFLLGESPMRDGFLKKFREQRALPADGLEQFFALLDRLARAYPRDEGDRVPSHNDLFKPDNILFDGDQAWLVDWEASFPNDRYADLAVVAAQVVTSDDEERAYLEAYFDAPPNEYQRARLHVMQQLAHLFYTMAFLHQAPMLAPVSWDEPVPTFEEHRSRYWAGELDLSDRATRLTYGRVNWARLLHNVQQPRFEAALALIRRD